MALEIQEWLWDNIGWKIRNVYRSIRNVIRWIPVIWKDRDWDDWYIYTILETKLKHQAKYIGDRDWHTEAKRDAERMMLCVRLIQKIKEESYQGEYMKYHDTKFYSEPVDDHPGYHSLQIETLSESFDEYFLAYPLDYKRVLNGAGWLDINDCTDDADKKKRIAMNMSHLRGQRAKKILFQLLERNIERWWD